MLSMDTENPDNGFMQEQNGSKFFLQSRIQKVPIRGFVAVTNITFPSVNQSAYWLEGFAGARVQLFKSNLYVDVNAQPRFLFYSTKQERNETL